MDGHCEQSNVSYLILSEDGIIMEEKNPYAEDEPVEIPHRHQEKINWFLLAAYIFIILWTIYYFIAYSK